MIVDASLPQLPRSSPIARPNLSNLLWTIIHPQPHSAMHYHLPTPPLHLAHVTSTETQIAIQEHNHHQSLTLSVNSSHWQRTFPRLLFQAEGR